MSGGRGADGELAGVAIGLRAPTAADPVGRGGQDHRDAPRLDGLEAAAVAPEEPKPAVAVAPANPRDLEWSAFDAADDPPGPHGRT